MDKRIEKILQIDADARKRITKANELAQKISNSVDVELDRLKNESDKKAEIKIEAIKKEQKKTIASFEEQKKRENAEISERLEKIADENGSKWVETIYNRVIG